jgi:hypothetical protein
MEIESVQDVFWYRERRHDDDIERSHIAQHIDQEFLRLFKQFRATLRAQSASVADWENVGRLAPRAKAFIPTWELCNLLGHRAVRRSYAESRWRSNLECAPEHSDQKQWPNGAIWNQKAYEGRNTLANYTGHRLFRSLTLVEDYREGKRRTTPPRSSGVDRVNDSPSGAGVFRGLADVDFMGIGGASTMYS